jgi:hypothetical protein
LVDDRINIKLVSQTPAICDSYGETVLIVVIVIVVVIVVVVIVVIIVVV